jgi:5-(carboxyamino)imidazole ribonucleotide synthase
MLMNKDNSNLIPNGLTIGIIGGGQLGKMIGLEAKRMSMKIAILDPDPNCPASTIADKVIIDDFKNESSIRKLAEISDVLTYEIELTNSSILEDLVSQNFTVHPSPQTLRIIQNKFRQKQFLLDNGIPVARFERAESLKQIKRKCNEFGYPVVLKACEDSYDGRGNYIVKSPEDIETGIRLFNRECMVEEFINFSKEVSIMVARNIKGQIQSFPVAENVHNENILSTTIVPARISELATRKARELAEKTIEILKGAGIFGIEMFVLQDDSLLINEIAPRPHNSGHYSIEACSISQFEQHIRAIVGLPISKPILLSPAVMINILGNDTFSGVYSLANIKKIMNISGLKLHVYGKQITKPRRKLGHMTIMDTSLERALFKAKMASSMICIKKRANPCE